MKLRGLLFAIPCLALFSALCATAPFGDPAGVGKRSGRAAQQPGKFREYQAWEYNNFPMPPDANVPGEWVFARFMYRSVPMWRPRELDHRLSAIRPAPSAAVRRLTRIQTRSVEQPVAAEDGDDIYNWPWLYGVEVGHWDLTELEAAKLRDYLLRGGFFMCDDFHGTWEWQTLRRKHEEGVPGPADCGPAEQRCRFFIQCSIWTTGTRYRANSMCTRGRTAEKDGYEARWRGIYDDKGRVMVAICHNMDLGDSWEHADDPTYPEQYSALGFRIGVNYLVYAMTH